MGLVADIGGLIEMKIEDFATFIHNCGFNVTTVTLDSKRPYVPIREDPHKWTRDTPLSIEELLQSINQIKSEGKEALIGFFPGYISKGKYKGKYTWAIDFDDKDLIDALQITLGQCKEKGIWIEQTRRKGHHLYGISELTAHDEKQHELSIELFGTSNTFIIIYNNFQHELYGLKPTPIEKNWKVLINQVQQLKGITSPTSPTISPKIKTGVQPGSRNISAFKLACNYRKVGFSKEEAITLMLDWNKHNKPPLHDNELITTVKSAYKSDYTEGEIDARKKLLSEYKVFSYKEIEDKTTGEKRYVISGINYPRLSKLLMEADGTIYISLKDNQEIWVYNGSYFEPLGQGILENRTGYYLDDLTTKKGKQEVVDFVRHYNYINREELNPPIHLINLKNGVFNIETGELNPHTSGIYFTNELPIIYNPNAKIDKINTFFETVLNLDDIPTIQEWFGDCIIRNYNRKKALLLVGATDTGKSKILGLLGLFLGLENTSNVSLHDICKDKFAPVELYGKYANICGDIAEANLRQIAMFLQTTGGDRIRGQQKYGKPFYFINYAKLVFSCNIIPDTEVKDDAYYNRWIVIECSNQFDEETKNQNILEEISTEEELSGLFNWALEGWKRLNENGGYTHYRDLEEVKEYMQKGKNPIREFIDTYIVSNPGSVVKKEYVYKCYVSFCKEYNYPIKESNVFSRKFKPLCPMNIDEGRQLKGGKRTWKGIKCNYDFPGEQQKVIG